MKKLPKDFVETFANRIPPWGPVGYVTFKRTYARLIEKLGRTEEWHEHCARLVNGLIELKAPYSDSELFDLYEMLFYMKGSVSGRAHWQLGTSTVRETGADSLCNCWFTAVDSPESFCFTFDELMLGGGVGFNIQAEHVYVMPKVRFKPIVQHVETPDCSFVVPDNRQGWVQLLRTVLDSFFNTGRPVTYSTQLIRHKGMPIKGFGGTASGAGALIDGITKICKVLQGAHRRKLRPVDCLDIMNIIGSVVVAGNVRRSAQIALGDPTDRDFLSAKNWGSGAIPSWRAMSNNSIVTSNIDQLVPEFWNGYNGSGEPYGLINLDAFRTYGRLADGPGYRDDPDVIGVNPCFPADVRFLTENGWRTFGESLDTCPVIHQDNRVTFDEDWVIDVRKPSNTVLTQAYNVRETQTTADVFTLKTKCGRSVHATADHHFATPYGMIPMESLEPGDKILVPLPECHKTDEDGDYLLGLVAGVVCADGCITNRSVRVDLWGHKRSIQSNIEELLTEVSPHSQFRESAHADKSFVNSVELFKLFDREGITKDSYDWLHLKSKNFKVGFVSGFFHGDGSVQLSNKSPSCRISQSDRGCLDTLNLILQELGILGKVYKRREGHTIQINGQRKYQAKASYELVVGGYEQVLRFNDVVVLYDYHSERLNSFLVGKNRPTYKSKYYATVESVEYRSTEPVYCLTEETRKTLVANGLTARRCAEIGLGNREACNLAEIYLPNIKSVKEFEDTAKLLYIACKTISRVPFSHKESEDIKSRNHRVGIGLTGWMAAPRWRDSKVLGRVYRHLEACDQVYSREMGINESIKLTTVKPSGTLSLLPDNCPPGIHPAFGRHLIRRIRFASNDPLVETCAANGYHVEPQKNFDGSENHDTMVISFPLAYSKDVVTEDNIGVIQQLKNQKFAQTHWADNSVSVTHYFRPNELPEVQQWLQDNYTDSVKACSFLPTNDHGFVQAPLEKITEDQYNELRSKCKPIVRVEDSGGHEIEGVECEGGHCPVK